MDFTFSFKDFCKIVWRNEGESSCLQVVKLHGELFFAYPILSKNWIGGEVRDCMIAEDEYAGIAWHPCRMPRHSSVFNISR